MKPEEMKDGAVYVLTRDVPNPDPDRRMTRCFAAAVTWTEGTRFAATVRPERTPELCAAGWRRGSISAHHDGFAALCAALEPAPRTFANVMQGINRDRLTDCAEAILEELTHQGKITLDDIEAANAAWRARPEE